MPDEIMTDEPDAGSSVLDAASTGADQCPKCEGRGWLLLANSGAGAAKRCDCFKRDLGGLRRRAAGVPRRYLHCRLNNFQTAGSDRGQKDQLTQARSMASRYVDEFLRVDGSFRESGLLFIGPPGTGKTHLAVAVLLELIDRFSVQGRFASFTDLTYKIQATYDPDSSDSEAAILEPIRQAEVLVLDELGAQKPTPWVMDVLYRIINERYSERRPTIFTTNYRLASNRDLRNAEAAEAAQVAEPVAGSDAEILRRGRKPRTRGPDLSGNAPELLSKRIEPYLISRVIEMSAPVVLDAVEDFRLTVKMHQHRQSGSSAE